MLQKLLAALHERPGPTRDTVGAPFSQRQLAVAVLLLELAQADRKVPPAELAAVGALLRGRFGLDAADASRLLASAREILGVALEDWVFARMVRDSFDATERAAVFSLLWEVVYADGQLARLEQDLIGHLARELGIGAAESEEARLQALARIRVAGLAADCAGTP